MQSSLIGKIQKARRYAEEKGRIRFSRLTAQFQGDHGSYTLSYEGGQWRCTCSFFSQWGTCSHTMALQRILSDMLSQEALSIPVTQQGEGKLLQTMPPP